MLLWRRNLNPFFDVDPGAGGGAAPAGGDPTAGVGGAPAGSTTPSAGGGEESIPKSQVENIVRTRLAEQAASINAKYKGHDKYKGIVEKMGKLTNKEIDALAQELEAIEIQVGAAQAGVNPQLYQSMITNQNEIKALREDNQRTKMDFEETTLKSNPVYGPAFADESTRTEIRDFAVKTGVTLEQAFWATQGTKRASQIESDTEKRVKASLLDAQARGGIINDTTSAPTDLGLTAQELAYCKETDTDPEDYAAAKNSNSIEAYRAHKKKKGKGA